MPGPSVNQEVRSPSPDRNVPLDQLDDDWDLNPPSPGALDSTMDIPEEGASPTSGFVEPYEGCSEAFPGGKTFMDAFRDDQYANERRQNLYFPFASHKEWQFASWLLHSRLTLTAINSLLALDIVRAFFLFFLLVPHHRSAPGHPSLLLHRKAAPLSSRSAPLRSSLAV
jgi:hypothetical protein